MIMSSNSTMMKINVIIGLSSGVRPPFLASAYIYVDRVSRPWLPLVNKVTAKSSIESVNARMKPENIPGLICGIITFLKACIGVAPRSNAAS